MKDSGIKWMGRIPSSWSIEKLKFHLVRHEPRNPGDKVVLSLYRELGVIPKDSRTDNHNVTSEDTSKYKYVRPGDFVINKMKAWQGSVAVSDYEGIVSPAYFVYSFTDDAYFKRYFHYLLRGCYKDEFMRLSGGIRVGQWDLPSEALDNVMVLIPPFPSQRLIAGFLDSKCAEIDALATGIQVQIDILEQYKRSVITETVTKGLNPHTEMKDSGIPWIGMIPAHWDCIRGKYILEYLQKPVKLDDEVITCFRDGEVTLRSNRREDGFTVADKEIGYQGIDIGDLVVHGMDGFAGAIGISDSRGKASPVLNVLDTEQDKRYIMYFLRSMAYGNVFLALATGIRIRSCDLRWNKLSELMYPIPPLDEQKEIVAYIDTILQKADAIVTGKKEQLEILDAYKKSLIFEYVTGKKEVPESVAVVGINPHVPLLAMVVDMLKKPRGEVVDQKLLYLCDVHLGLGLGTQYYRWDNGPLDLQLYSYIDTLVSNGWYKVDIQNKARLLVKAENHAEALKMYGNQFSQHKSSIEKLVQYFGEMRMGEIERFAALFAVWNDFIIEGILVPTDGQLINEVLTNWGTKKGRFSPETWGNTLMKMKRDGIIPKGLGLHTLPKPEGGISDA